MWRSPGRWRPAHSHFRRSDFYTLATHLPFPPHYGFLGWSAVQGYVEGHNVRVITRTAEWRPDQYEPLTTELVKRNVRVLFAAGPAVVRYAKSATTTTPSWR